MSGRSILCRTAAAILTVWLAALAPLAQAAPPAFPDSQPGKRAAAYLDAFNTAGDETMKAYLEENLAPTSLERMTIEQRLATLARIRADLGRLEPARISEETGGAVTVIGQGSTGTWFEMGFAFEPDPPHRLLGVRIELIDEPPDLDAPDTPLDEEQLSRELDEWLDDLSARDEFSGAVLVAAGDRPVFRRAYGLASKEYATPNRVDTRFNLGSINKFMTRIAIEQLALAGKLSLDDTIGALLPDYPNREAARKVTVRHLLEMTSGIGDFFGEKYEATPKDRIRDLEDYLPLFASAPLEFEPGTSNRYSNGGYVVLGLIIEKASGKDYFEYVRENIYEPAGMTATCHLESDKPVENVASGYTRNWDDREHPDEPRRNNLYMRPCRGSSAGGGYSTVDDLLKLVLALRAGKLGAPGTARMLEGGLGIAGGAPGINAAVEVEAGGERTIVVLSNYDPPTAMNAARKARGMLARLQ